MISFFDLEKLRGLLKDYYAISHIRTTVFDENLNELVSYRKRLHRTVTLSEAPRGVLTPVWPVIVKPAERLPESTAQPSTAVTPV